MSEPESETVARFYLERLYSNDHEWNERFSQQRAELERLQRRCNELQLQNTMQRAHIAEELSQFCIRFALAGSNTRQQQQQQQNGNNNFTGNNSNHNNQQ